MIYELNIEKLSQSERIKVIRKIAKKYTGVLWWSQRMYQDNLELTLEERFLKINFSGCLNALKYNSETNTLSTGKATNRPKIKLDFIQNKLK